MSKKSTGGSTNMLLIAAAGVGAFMLFANKGNAQSRLVIADTTSGGGDTDEIPTAPKILAVNSSSSESPTPTGIVSDDDGMEPAGSASSSNEASGDDYDSGSYVNRTTSAGTKAPISRQSQGDNIPLVISTTLTQKEKAIIAKGALSDDLAVKRPDLYKAIYIRKNGNGQKALQAVDAILQRIKVKGSNSGATSMQKKKRKVSITLNPNAANLVMAAAQASSSGMASMAALSTMSAMQYAAAKGKAPVRKGTVHHAPGSKGTHSQKRTTHPAAKHHTGATHHKAVSPKRP